jgi:hypothetical protein
MAGPARKLPSGTVHARIRPGSLGSPLQPPGCRSVWTGYGISQRAADACQRRSSTPHHRWPPPPFRIPDAVVRRRQHLRGLAVERHLQRLRQRLRVRYWLRFRRRHWPRLRPGFRRWRHRRRHWRWQWRRLHRFGPRRLRPRGFRLHCLTSIWSGVWHHLAGHLVVGHRGLTGTICGHPEMIPSRTLRPPRGGRPVSTSGALACAALRAGPRQSTHAGRTARWHLTGQVFPSCCGRGSACLVVLPAGVRERPRVGAGRVIVSWMPGECTPMLAAHARPGHLVVYCQAQGCLEARCSLRHEPTNSA